MEEISGSPNYKFIKGNICSPDLVNYVVQEEAIDTIMHFAAQTHVDNSFGNSLQFSVNNILGTHVLLESAKAINFARTSSGQPPLVKRFIHVSTDEVYGECGRDDDPRFEDEVLEPTNPYAATKAGAEFLAKSYHRSFNLPVIITRGNNVYGPHQYPEKLIPKFVNQLMRNMKLTLHGNGLNTRNYLYVTDVANAFDVILHKAIPGKIYNIGGKNERSNMQVAYDILRSFYGIGEDIDGSNTADIMRCFDQYFSNKVTFVEDRPFNDLRYSISSDLVRSLGWVERVPWADGLRDTVAWYQLHSMERYGDCNSALVSHPRAGSNTSDTDSMAAVSV